jgi:hypothetical protein
MFDLGLSFFAEERVRTLPPAPDRDDEDEPELECELPPDELPELARLELLLLELLELDEW